MSMSSPAIPEWEELDIPVDDKAEPEDADISHTLENDHTEDE